MMNIRVWGVRGSIPCPGPETVHYGGNTTCLEVRFEKEDRYVIIGAGSGIRSLGNWIVKNELPKGPVRTQIFISHTHWDHIMGFPFFTPIFIPGTELTIYGPVTYEEDGLDKIIGGQLSYRYFPVRQVELAAKIDYVALQECSMDLGNGIWVTTKYLNHPILCLGYRFEYKGKVFCTAFDTEPFRNVFPTDPEDPDYDRDAAEEGEKAAREENERVWNFLRGADLLIHDSQYTRQEYVTGKIGWGHSYFEWVINCAHKAGVKKLLLFHHDPMRTDKELTQLYNHYLSLVEGKTTMEIAIAREREEIIL